MRYDVNEKQLYIDAVEAAALCIRHTDADIRVPAVTIAEVQMLTGILPLDGYTVALSVNFMKPDGGAPVAVFPVSDGVPSSTREKEIDTVAYLAMLVYRMEYGKTLPVGIGLYDAANRQTSPATVGAVPEKLTLFLKRFRSVLRGVILPFAIRVETRLPTLAALKFPYGSLRRGQKEMIESVYHACRVGETLFLTAPTGTGKTVSVLFPAVRAVGQGAIEKIFYLTPKSTTALAAADTLRTFYESGADLRAVVITSKEKICTRDTECRVPGNNCRYIFADREKITAAALRLLERGLPVIGDGEIRAEADAAGVCPYELTLRYAELCDAVICDYNYLFDPDAFIRRFFTDGGKYAFLVDEAHTLAERATEIYSASFSPDFFDTLLPPADGDDAGQVYDKIREIAEDYRHITARLLRDSDKTDDHGVPVRFLSTGVLPDEMQNVFAALSETLTHAMQNRDYSDDARHIFRHAFYAVSSFVGKMELFSRKYRCFLEEREERCTVRLVCLDPSDAIGNCIRKGKCAVFFSATLTPVAYYRSVLCGDAPAVTVETETPFRKEQMAVAVMDSVSVRFREREDSLLGITELIRRMIAAKVGNYMVFCPSFSYMETLFRAFRQMAPAVAAIAQKRCMTGTERDAFLSRFVPDPEKSLVGFCVAGGIFGEGVDLAGTRLVGAAVIGIGIPSLSAEREAMRAYYDEKSENGHEYAYIYPGLNRVLQAAGRVIRRTTDHGVILLCDDRFSDPLYRKILPKVFPGIRYVGDAPSLSHFYESFWGSVTD